MDGQGLGHFHHALAAAFQLFHALFGPALSKNDFRQGERLVDAHAAMAEGAFGIVEQTARGRVMQIDGMFIGEHELDPAQRIALAWRLADADLALAMADLIAETLEIGRIVPQPWHHLLLDDGRRHVPVGIDDQELHGIGKQRRRCLRLADDHAGLMHHLVTAIDAHLVVGNVHLDAVMAHVARHPAPAFHIGDDLVLEPRGLPARKRGDRARRERAGRRKAIGLLETGHGFDHTRVVDQIVRGDRLVEPEARADQRHAIVLHAGLQHWSRGDGALRNGRCGLAQFGQLVAQRAIAAMLRIVAFQHCARVRCRGHLDETAGRLDELGLLGDLV